MISPGLPFAAATLLFFVTPGARPAASPQSPQSPQTQQAQGVYPFPCECIHGIYRYTPPGSRSTWGYEIQSYSDDGLCTAQLPPCGPLMGCLIDYNVTFQNQSGQAQYVFVRYPSGDFTKTIVKADDIWAQEISSVVDCGENIRIDVTDGSYALLICTSCQTET